jgi:hypothetical protein
MLYNNRCDNLNCKEIFGLLIAVFVQILICFITPCNLVVSRYQHFGETCFNPEDGESMFHRNTGNHLQVYSATIQKTFCIAVKLYTLQTYIHIT